MKTISRWAITIALTALSVSCQHTHNRTEAAAQRPLNIIWIYTDDHAQQAISAYGSVLNKTPHLDRLATEGMRFENSFVANSICAPCRAIILTGKHSHHNGLIHNGSKFDGDQQTFPKLLRRAGYQTALIGKWHLKTDPTGFDHWEILGGQGQYYNPAFLSREGRKIVPGYTTDLITDKAIDWIEHRQTDKPFMVMVQHKAPHRSWEPGPDHLTTYEDTVFQEPATLHDDYSTRTSATARAEMSVGAHLRPGPDLKAWTPEQIEKYKGAYNWMHGRMNKEQAENWDEAYAARIADWASKERSGKELTEWNYQAYMKDYLRCIASVDDNVGRLLDYIEDEGLADHTVVFYSSDQGFYLGEHGWYDKRWMYEESLRTPLLVRWPSVTKPGSTTDLMVQNIDMAGTFLELAGVPIPDDMQGRSLVPLMKGEEPEDWRKAIYYQYYQGAGSTHHVHVHRGVRNERYKIIHYHAIGEWELFDLEEDPHELHNRYDDPAYADRVVEMKALLEETRQRYDIPVPRVRKK